MWTHPNNMKRLISILFLSTFLTTAFGQKYLIRNRDWVLKINQNPSLSPLSFGIKKTQRQILNDSQITSLLLKKYKTKDLAYRQQIIDGWNYFIIGRVDSAIIYFNQAYLIDKKNLEAFFAIGSIITFIDREPNNELIEHYHLIDKVSSAWDLTAFYGDLIFLEKLNGIHKDFPTKEPLFKILTTNSKPYEVDSAKFVMVKLKTDNHEGYYRMGRQYGQWTDYYESEGQNVMRNYTIIDGRESGKITAFHKNGKLSSIFYKDKNGDIDGEFKIFDYNGDLVRIEYWHKNSHDSKDSKIIKEWEEDGTTTEMVDGQFKEFIWKDGKKSPKQ
jgi:tetratricopeptide (TPR) repeat protein